jgi:hypothetical protein
MARRTISDLDVQEAIAVFIEEASTCASTRCHGEAGILGYPAMLLMFSCILAVGESLHGERDSAKVLIGAFCEELWQVDRGWLLPPDNRRSRVRSKDVADWLYKVRNGLVHVLEMPPKVRLLPNWASQKSGEEDQWRIVVPHFISAVERTIRQVTQKQPNLPWDPGPPPSGLVGRFLRRNR